MKEVGRGKSTDKRKEKKSERRNEERRIKKESRPRLGYKREKGANERERN